MQFRLLAAGLAALNLVAALPWSLSTEVNEAPIERRFEHLTQSGLAKLKSIGMGSQPGVPATGVNAKGPGKHGVWIGGGGPYEVTYTNYSPNEVVLVVWGDKPEYQASFVKAVQPLITISLAGHNSGKGDSATLSFKSGQSGAWAGVYKDTVLTDNGQIKQTWGEFTMSPPGVVDVSREVFTKGDKLAIIGPDCKTDMSECVFKCKDPKATTCYVAGSYHLVNCNPKKQKGAVNTNGATSGGCGWLGKKKVHLKAEFR